MLSVQLLHDGHTHAVVESVTLNYLKHEIFMCLKAHHTSHTRTHMRHKHKQMQQLKINNDDDDNMSMSVDDEYEYNTDDDDDGDDDDDSSHTRIKIDSDKLLQYQRELHDIQQELDLRARIRMLEDGVNLHKRVKKVKIARVAIPLANSTGTQKPSSSLSSARRRHDDDSGKVHMPWLSPFLLGQYESHASHTQKVRRQRDAFVMRSNLYTNVLPIKKQTHTNDEGGDGDTRSRSRAVGRPIVMLQHRPRTSTSFHAARPPSSLQYYKSTREQHDEHDDDRHHGSTSHTARPHSTMTHRSSSSSSSSARPHSSHCLLTSSVLPSSSSSGGVVLVTNDVAASPLVPLLRVMPHHAAHHRVHDDDFHNIEQQSASSRQSDSGTNSIRLINKSKYVKPYAVPHTAR